MWTGRRWPPAASSTWRGTCGTRPRPRRPCAARSRWRAPRARVWPSRCRTPSAWSATGTSSWPSSRAVSTCCSPTTWSSRRCSRWMTSTRPFGWWRATARWRPSRAGPRALSWWPATRSRRWRSTPWTGSAGRSRRRHHRCRRPLRRRVPLRAGPGCRPGGLRRPGRPGRGRGHHPPGRPAPGAPASAGGPGRPPRPRLDLSDPPASVRGLGLVLLRGQELQGEVAQPHQGRRHPAGQGGEGDLQRLGSLQHRLLQAQGAAVGHLQ